MNGIDRPPNPFEDQDTIRGVAEVCGYEEISPFFVINHYLGLGDRDPTPATIAIRSFMDQGIEFLRDFEDAELSAHIRTSISRSLAFLLGGDSREKTGDTFLMRVSGYTLGTLLFENPPPRLPGDYEMVWEYFDPEGFEREWGERIRGAHQLLIGETT